MMRSTSGRFFSTTWVASHYVKAGNHYQDSFKPGAFFPDIPEGKKPTHIIVGAGSAGCVLVCLLFAIVFYK